MLTFDDSIIRGRSMMLAVVACILGGCAGSDELHVEYGVSRGHVGQTSINGTAVLDKMFRDAGHRVVSTSRLSSRLDAQDIIVWFPQRGVPKEEAVEFLESWLSDQPNRTLVFVNRGFDLQHQYWKRAARLTDDTDHATALRRRGAEALVEEIIDRREMDNSETCSWFSVRHDRHLPLFCTNLRGPWLAGVDRARSDLYWADRFDFPPSNFERTTLLADSNIPIVTQLTRPDWVGSKIIVVTNSAFLLNLGLINRQHRLLAGHLIDVCARPEGEGRVAFLETASAAIGESTDDPERTLLSIFFQWPLCVPFWHVLAAGFVACSAYFPCLGRPRPAPRESIVDFGRHVEALGQLLAETRDEPYARARLDEYLNYSQNESKSYLGVTSLRKGNHP